MVEIRDEQPADIPAIGDVNLHAFGGHTEGELVDALRSNGGAILSLVALVDGRVAGHILFSPVQVNDLTGAALAPMAVLPEYQHRGIGSQLVRAGVARLEQLGCPFVLVLGHPRYYPRFGFKPAAQYGITCEWEVPSDVFMVLVLDESRMTSASGPAVYRPEFASVT
jgi:putative acetyltransferase